MEGTQIAHRLIAIRIATIALLALMIILGCS